MFNQEIQKQIANELKNHFYTKGPYKDNLITQVHIEEHLKMLQALAASDSFILKIELFYVVETIKKSIKEDLSAEETYRLIKEENEPAADYHKMQIEKDKTSDISYKKSLNERFQTFEEENVPNQKDVKIEFNEPEKVNTRIDFLQENQRLLWELSDLNTVVSPDSFVTKPSSILKGQGLGLITNKNLFIMKRPIQKIEKHPTHITKRLSKGTNKPNNRFKKGKTAVTTSPEALEMEPYELTKTQVDELPQGSILGIFHKEDFTVKELKQTYGKQLNEDSILNQINFSVETPSGKIKEEEVEALKEQFNSLPQNKKKQLQKLIEEKTNNITMGLPLQHMRQAGLNNEIADLYSINHAPKFVLYEMPKKNVKSPINLPFEDIYNAMNGYEGFLLYDKNIYFVDEKSITKEASNVKKEIRDLFRSKPRYQPVTADDNDMKQIETVTGVPRGPVANAEFFFDKIGDKDCTVFRATQALKPNTEVLAFYGPGYQNELVNNLSQNLHKFPLIYDPLAMEVNFSFMASMGVNEQEPIIIKEEEESVSDQLINQFKRETKNLNPQDKTRHFFKHLVTYELLKQHFSNELILFTTLGLDQTVFSRLNRHSQFIINNDTKEFIPSDDVLSLSKPDDTRVKGQSFGYRHSLQQLNPDDSVENLEKKFKINTLGIEDSYQKARYLLDQPKVLEKLKDKHLEYKEVCNILGIRYKGFIDVKSKEYKDNEDIISLEAKHKSSGVKDRPLDYIRSLPKLNPEDSIEDIPRKFKENTQELKSAYDKSRYLLEHPIGTLKEIKKKYLTYQKLFERLEVSYRTFQYIKKREYTEKIAPVASEEEIMMGFKNLAQSYKQYLREHQEQKNDEEQDPNNPSPPNLLSKN